MLFLAVFLGFLAEYRLEHFIEHKRTVELAKNLYEELKGDSTEVQNKIKGRIFKEECLMYIRDYFRDSSLVSLPREFYPRLSIGFILNNYYQFDPKDGMLNQLTNSGSLRYFRNAELQQNLGEIAVVIKNIKAWNERESEFLTEFVTPFLIDHYDYTWLTLITKEGSIGSFEAFQKYLSGDTTIQSVLLNVNKLNKQKTYNIISQYLNFIRGNRQLRAQKYIDVNKKLLNVLKDNYNVE